MDILVAFEVLLNFLSVRLVNVARPQRGFLRKHKHEQADDAARVLEQVLCLCVCDSLSLALSLSPCLPPSPSLSLSPCLRRFLFSSCWPPPICGRLVLWCGGFCFLFGLVVSLLLRW